jgi:general secretion pathway protein M
MAHFLQQFVQRIPGLEARLNQMNQREKLLVSIAAVLLVITLVYFIAWKPLADGIAERQAKIDAQQELLQWVRENTGRFLAQNGAQSGGGQSTDSMPTSNISGTMSERVTRLASAAKIEVTRMQPQSDSLVVVIDQVPFNALLQLIENLETQAGLVIEHLDATEGGEPGIVRVRRLQVVE